MTVVRWAASRRYATFCTANSSMQRCTVQSSSAQLSSLVAIASRQSTGQNTDIAVWLASKVSRHLSIDNCLDTLLASQTARKQGLNCGGSHRISDPAPLVWDPLPLITDHVPHNRDPAPFCGDPPLLHSIYLSIFLCMMFCRNVVLHGYFIIAFVHAWCG